jgi:hypothetical protein
MADTTMTQEGDRSGVETPDNKEKAYRRLCAARNATTALIGGWDDMKRIDRVSTIQHIIEQLEGAKLHAIKGSE